MDLKEPFLFNPIKHHLPYILKFIEQYRHDINNDQVEEELLRIGGSQTDLYIGVTDIDEIIIQLSRDLKQLELFEKQAYLDYLNAYKGHFAVNIKDGSTWILRKGIEERRYIHIHPGRYSKFTVRVKAITLKSFVAGALLADRISAIDLETINRGREGILHLPPIKKLNSSNVIGSLVRIAANCSE